MLMSNVCGGDAIVDGEPSALALPFVFTGVASLFTDFIDMMSSASFAAWPCLNFFAMIGLHVDNKTIARDSLFHGPGRGGRRARRG